MSMNTPYGEKANAQPSALIDRLTDELEPVRPLTMRDGSVLVGFAVLITVLAVELIEGLWGGAFNGDASPYFVVANCLLLLLGIAASVGVIGMASPRVGNRHEGPKWAMAMAAVIPLAAIVTIFGHDHPADATMATLSDPYGVTCMLSSLVAALLTATALVAWLRRGAPVSTAAAGLHIGVAAGALGSVAYGLSCPIDSVMHIGVWHAAPVVIAALAGRFALPHLLRW